MGDILFEIIWMLIFALCSYSVFRILKKLGKPKIGLAIAVIVFLILIVELLTNFVTIGFWLILLILYLNISFGIYFLLMPLR